MNPVEIFFLVFQLAALYVLFRTVAGLNLRLTALERQPRQLPTFKAPPPVQEWQKPIDNFTPKKPDTLRPENGKAVEVLPGVFDFE